MPVRCTVARQGVRLQASRPVVAYLEDGVKATQAVLVIVFVVVSDTVG